MIVDGFRAAGMPTFEPEGAFYCFPDITSTGLSSEEFAQELLQSQHVAVVPGDAFGPSGGGFCAMLLRQLHGKTFKRLYEELHCLQSSEKLISSHSLKLPLMKYASWILSLLGIHCAPCVYGVVLEYCRSRFWLALCNLG